MTEHECEYRSRYGNQMVAGQELLDHVADLENRLDTLRALVRRWRECSAYGVPTDSIMQIIKTR
jgi:hypothetical protein